MDGPTPEEIAEEFGKWHIWQGVAGWWYARRRKTSPPVVVKAQDLAGLREELVKQARP